MVIICGISLISRFCLFAGQSNQIFAAYALRDWAFQIGLTLLPQTTETLLASTVFNNDVPHVPIDLLNPERIVIRSGIKLNRLIPQIRKAIAMVNATETPDEATVLEAVNRVTQALAEHPFVADPLAVAQTTRLAVFKQIQFTFWSAVTQALDSSGSRIAQNEHFARISKVLVNEGYEIAVLSWISCLLKKDRIAALCCGGLTSTK